MANEDPPDHHWRETRSRLLLARQLWRHGREHSEQSGNLNQMIAVHNVHNAVEIALRTVLFYLREPSANAQLTFPELLVKVEGSQYFQMQHLTLPLRAEMRTLNELRNLVQHRAFEPSDVSRWVVLAESFLVQVCRSVFAVEFDSISPIDLVEDEKLRELLAYIERTQRDGKTMLCVEGSLLAFQGSLESILDFGDAAGDDDATTERALGAELGGFVGALGLGGSALSLLNIGFGDITKKIIRAERMSFLLACGVSIPNYKRYARLEWLGPEGCTAEDAAWISRFVVDTVVDWQTGDYGPRITAAWSSRIAQFLGQGVSMAIFRLQLEPTYYANGFFNVPVDYDNYVRREEGSVTLVIGDNIRIDGRIDRSANTNRTARIHGRAKLRDWFQANFKERDYVNVDLSDQGIIRLFA